MRLKVSRSKNSASLYVIKSTWENKVHSTKIVEKLGTYAELKEKLGDRDPYEWAKEYVDELNRKEKEGKEPPVIAKYSPSKQLEKDERHTFHGGYLFLKRLYYELGFTKSAPASPRSIPLNLTSTAFCPGCCIRAFCSRVPSGQPLNCPNASLSSLTSTCIRFTALWMC